MPGNTPFDFKLIGCPYFEDIVLSWLWKAALSSRSLAKNLKSMTVFAKQLGELTSLMESAKETYKEVLKSCAVAREKSLEAGSLALSQRQLEKKMLE